MLKVPEPPAERRWSRMGDFIITFFVSVVLAGVVSYYICKWLDKR